MAQVLVGDAHLDLAKAKKLASSMGGAWHDEEDVESEPEQHGGCPSSKAEEVQLNWCSPTTLLLCCISVSLFIAQYMSCFPTAFNLCTSNFVQQFVFPY